jgi:hypothetical protein
VVFSDDSYQPATYLKKLKRFAQNYYVSSEIYQSSPTMVLELNHIKFELVPAIKGGWLNPYQIPAPASDYSDWIGTDPNDFNQSLIDKNKNHSNLIKPLVRLVKYWNANNNYVFDSYSLEKDIVNQSFWLLSDLKGYFYSTIDQLSLDLSAAQWKQDKLAHAKKICSNAKQYEDDDMPYSAESEIKKLIPSVT